MRLDNTTAVSYINAMGGIKSVECDELARVLWQWCIERDIWATAAHLPGVENVIADKRSRNFRDETEWMLNPKVFKELCNLMGTPQIDLFASRLNTQLSDYVSWQPDPGAQAINAFTLDWGGLEFYAFPPFCIINKCLQKVVEDKAEGILIVPKWASQSWFPRLLQLLIDVPTVLPQSEHTLIQTETGKIHPLCNKLFLLACRLSWNRSRQEAFRNQLDPSYWRHGEKSTRKQYISYIRRWIHFCHRQSTDPLQTHVGEILDFLTNLMESGIGYSAINTAKCAIGSYALFQGGQSLKDNQMVARFMKGVFNLKPPRPRYSDIWDVGKVLDYIRSIPVDTDISLQDLTLKLCMLILLLSAQRVQTLHLLRIDNLDLQEDSARFTVTGLLKQSRPGNCGVTICLNEYPFDKRLCVVQTLRLYLTKTGSLRGEEKRLFISYKRPHRAVSKDTIARWAKEGLSRSGINIAKYKPHSTSAASTSAAEARHVPICDIMLMAGWSSENTFRPYYNKPLIEKHVDNFQRAVLEA